MFTFSELFTRATRKFSGNVVIAGLGQGTDQV
jgi:hypothetical protein